MSTRRNVHDVAASAQTRPQISDPLSNERDATYAQAEDAAANHATLCTRQCEHRRGSNQPVASRDAAVVMVRTQTPPPVDASIAEDRCARVQRGPVEQASKRRHQAKRSPTATHGVRARSELQVLHKTPG